MLKALGDLINGFFESANAMFRKSGDEANHDLDVTGHATGLIDGPPPVAPMSFRPANWVDPVKKNFARASRPIVYGGGFDKLGYRREIEEMKGGR